MWFPVRLGLSVLLGLLLWGCGDTPSPGPHTPPEQTPLNLDSDIIPMPDLSADTGIGFDQITLCRKVDRETRTPVDPLLNARSAAGLKYTPLYLYMEPTAKKPPGKLVVRWMRWQTAWGRPGAWREVHSYAPDVPRRRWKTWAKKNHRPGLFRVDVLTRDRRYVIWTHSYAVWGEGFSQADCRKLLSGWYPGKDVPADRAPDVTVTRGTPCVAVNDDYEPIQPGTDFLRDDLSKNRLWLYLEYRSAVDLKPVLQVSRRENGRFVVYRRITLNFPRSKAYKTKYYLTVPRGGIYLLEIITPNTYQSVWRREVTIREGGAPTVSAEAGTATTSM